MRCEQCGGEVDDRQTYCGRCGVMFEPGSANDVPLHQDNRDDSKLLYEQLADRDYEAQQHPSRGEAAYDGAADAGPVPMLPPEQYPHPLPDRAERSRRPNLIAVVAGVWSSPGWSPPASSSSTVVRSRRNRRPT